MNVHFLKCSKVCPSMDCQICLISLSQRVLSSAVDLRGHRSAAEDAGSYLLFKPAAATSINSPESDYMAMPGVLKAGTVETTDADRSSRVPASSLVESFSSSPASDYMEMAARALHGAKVGHEPGGKRLAESTSKKSSTGCQGTDDYMSMKATSDEGYIDMKNFPSRCTGWLLNFILLSDNVNSFDLSYF